MSLEGMAYEMLALPFWSVVAALAKAPSTEKDSDSFASGAPVPVLVSVAESVVELPAVPEAFGTAMEVAFVFSVSVPVPFAGALTPSPANTAVMVSLPAVVPASGE